MEDELALADDDGVAGVVAALVADDDVRLLGEAGINIAGMTFGRTTPGGDAITVLNVDGPVSKDVLARIKKSQHVVNARLIKL